MRFHQFRPGPYLWALAPWPGPWPWPWPLLKRQPVVHSENFEKIGPPGPIFSKFSLFTTSASPPQNNKTLSVFTSLALGLALGPGPGPWPPGQALGLITFALWGGWDPGPGPLPKSTQQLLPKKNSKTLCVFTSFGWDHICGPLLPAPGPGHVVTSFGPGSWPWDRVAGQPSAPI